MQANTHTPNEVYPPNKKYRQQIIYEELGEYTNRQITYLLTSTFSDKKKQAICTRMHTIQMTMSKRGEIMSQLNVNHILFK